MDRAHHSTWREFNEQEEEMRALFDRKSVRALLIAEIRGVRFSGEIVEDAYQLSGIDLVMHY